MGLTPLGWLPAEKALKRPAPTFRKMASARIERALLPVQRNRTLNLCTSMNFLLWRAAWIEIGGERRAELGPAAAAVLEQEQSDLAEAVEVRAVDDGAALPFAVDQPGAREDRQMRRHRVLGNL